MVGKVFVEHAQSPGSLHHVNQARWDTLVIPGTRESEAGRSQQIWGQPGLHDTLSQKKNKQNSGRSSPTLATVSLQEAKWCACVPCSPWVLFPTVGKRLEGSWLRVTQPIGWRQGLPSRSVGTSVSCLLACSPARPAAAGRLCPAWV